MHAQYPTGIGGETAAELYVTQQQSDDSVATNRVAAVDHWINFHISANPKLRHFGRVPMPLICGFGL